MDTFRSERKFLLVANCYPTPKPNFLYILIGIFTISYSYTELGTMLAAIYVERENLQKLSEVLYFCMTQVAFLCKLTNFIVQKRKMVAIEEILRQPAFNDLNADEEKILERYMASFRYLAFTFRILCVLCVIFYGLFPFIDKDPQHMLPLPGWFPFDIKTYQYHLLVAQTLGVAIGSTLNSSVDLIAIALISIGSAQFDILKSKLRTSFDQKQNGRAKIDPERLKGCVIYHQMLLEYVKKIEDLFGIGILLQIVASCIVICLTGFQMLVISFKSAQFVLLMVYFSTMMCQVVLYCWYGNELMYNSMGISEACYMSNWNNCDSNFNKSLWIIMEKGKRPVTLTAGKLFTLSLVTLMTILRSSYSYFAVLQRLYSKQ